MPKKIIGILGSPLPKGNTAVLLEKALEGARAAGAEVERIDVPSLNFVPCREIFYCTEHETCRIQDDMTEMYQKFRNLDGLIIATPVMTMGIPGKLKSFMDRFQVYYMAKYLRKKPLVPEEKRKSRRCLFISISGMKDPSVFVGAKMTAQAFCRIIDCSYGDEILVPDMDTIQDIRKKPDVLQEAYEKGYALGK
ncbi:MAG: flavodoxin family protein [Methanomicrobiales archaeon]|nr:flavodoxin family protein [Methanomicrobiales archaeon]